MRTFALLLAFASTVSADVVLDVPKEVSFFEAPVIRVTGLRPLHPVTLRVTCVDAAGVPYTSSARFIPRLDGVVDTRQSIARGEYQGVDPMAPFWSLAGKGPFTTAPDAEVVTTVEVLDAKSQVLASGTTARRMIPRGVRVTQLRRPASPALDLPFDEGAVIPVERIRGAVFLAAAGDDLLWPSLRMARAIKKRLEQHRFRYPVERHEYPESGHQLSPPGVRIGPLPGGGTPDVTARAGADAWTKAVSFLEANLKRRR